MLLIGSAVFMASAEPACPMVDGATFDMLEQGCQILSSDRSHSSTMRAARVFVRNARIAS
jgi:hypothetical protein